MLTPTRSLGRARLPIALLLACMPVASQAQGSDGPPSVPGRVPVPVALVASLSDPSSEAMIVRRANAQPQDLILLTRHGANGRQLSAAIFTLLAARALQGDRPLRDATIR